MRAAMIPAARLRKSLRAQAVPLALGASIMVLALLGEPARELLQYDRAAILRGEVWRLLTHVFVHLGGYHAVLNLLGLLALVLLCPARIAAREWMRRVVVLVLLGAAALWLWLPELHRYVGFSGVLHGLFLLGLWPQAVRRDRVAQLCLVYLVFKLGWEMWMGAPLSDEIAIGGRVVTHAHLFGTLAGLVYGLATRVWRKGETIT